MDGGSTDGTIDALEDYASKYPLRWESAPDSGMYEAINKGLGIARGEIIGYLNSDDLYLPWSIEEAVVGLDGGTDLVFGDLGLFLEGPAGVHDLELRFYPAFQFPYYVHVATMAQPTVFWHRRVVDAIGGFDETYALLGDCDYWLRAASAGFELRHLDEILALQFDHPGTLRSTRTDLLASEFRRLRDSYRETVPPPWWSRISPVAEKLKRRRDLLTFRTEVKRSMPRRWSRFIRFLRDIDVKLNDKELFAFFLPRSLRRSGPRWLDSEKILQAVLDRGRNASR